MSWRHWATPLRFPHGGERPQHFFRGGPVLHVPLQCFTENGFLSDGIRDRQHWQGVICYRPSWQCHTSGLYLLKTRAEIKQSTSKTRFFPWLRHLKHCQELGTATATSSSSQLYTKSYPSDFWEVKLRDEPAADLEGVCKIPMENKGSFGHCANLFLRARSRNAPSWDLHPSQLLTPCVKPLISAFRGFAEPWLQERDKGCCWLQRK